MTDTQPSQKYWFSFASAVNNDSVASFISFVLDKIYQDKRSEFYVYISSLGGDIDSSIRFYDFCKSLRLNLTTIGYGQVQSAAIVLFLTGKNKLIHKDCSVRFHSPRYNSPEQSQVIEVVNESNLRLNVLDKRYISILAKELHKTEDEIRETCNQGTLLTGKEAVDFGMADDVFDKMPL